MKRYEDKNMNKLDSAVVAQQAGETYTMGVGRARERADVLDFIRNPPGRVPDQLRRSLTDLARVIERGDHVGGARRLYEDLPWLRELACGTDTAAADAVEDEAMLAARRAAP